MKNILLFIALFFYSVVDISAENNFLSGEVRDKKTNELLIGVSIYIPDLKTGAITDIVGRYKINNLPKAKVLVRVSFIGYASISESIDLTITNSKDFLLEESITEMKTVVVTGESHTTEIKKDPVPIVLIDPQYISQNSSTNIIEALGKIGGLSTISTGPNVSKPIIHGLGYNRVLTLFDGVRQEGQQWGDEHGIEIDQFLIDRIEVVKGPASLMYGSDAIAGVVNLIPANAVPEGTIKGNILANYLTNNKQVAGSFALDGNHKGFEWGFRASHKQASDYQNKNDGRVYGTKYNESDLNAYFGLHRSWGYSHLNFSLFDNLQEIPDGSRDSSTRKFTKQVNEADTGRVVVSNAELNSYNIALLHQHVQFYRVYSNSNFVFEKSKLTTNFGFTESIRREFDHPAFAEVAGLYLDLKVLTYDVKYYFPEIKKVETTIGLNGMSQNNSADKGTAFVIPNYHSFDVGPFLHLKRSFGKLDLSTGVRYDMRMFQNDAMFTKVDLATGLTNSTASDPADTNVLKQFDFYKHTFSGLSAGGGMTYNFNDDLGIKMNISRGYRAPNVAEISSKGIHPGTGFEQLGDVNFKPEFSLQEDAGLFFSAKHISGSVELFNNNLSNYIYDEKLQSVLGGDSVVIEKGNAFPVFKYRQTTAQLFGGEISLDIHPHPLDQLHFENSISYINAMNLGGNGVKTTDSTKYLPLIPPFHTNTELRADIKRKLKYFSAVFFKIGVQYYAMQDHFYSAYGTETKTPGYTLIDAGLGANVTNKKGKTVFSFNILGTNLTGLAYQSNMNRMKYFDNYPVNGTGRSGIYNMGRNISFKIIIPFDIKSPKVDDTIAPI